MPIDPRVPAWAGPAPKINTDVVDLQRAVQQLLAEALSIPNGAIAGSQIQPGTITSTQIAAGSITAGSIAAGSIVAGDIAANAVTAGTIAAGAVTAATIAAGAITAGAIAANAVTAGTIAANAVTSGTIAANAVGTAQLAAGAVTSTIIATGAVTASAISVSNLSAVSANMGTVTGGIFQTGSSGARVMFGTGMTTPTGVTAGIVGIDGSNNVTFSIDATTGNVVLKGTLQQGSNGLGNIAGVTQNAITQVAGANLVTNWSFTAATPITQFIGTNYNTPTQDTVVYLTAPGSLKTVVTSAGTASLTLKQTSSTNIPVTAGSVYSASGYFLAAVNRLVTPSIAWYNVSATLISTSSVSAIQCWANQWTRLYIENVTAPAGAVVGVPNFSVAGAAASEVHNWDDFIFVNQPTASVSTIIVGSITATEIQAGTITGTQIAANSITAGNLSVGSLSAISANAGTITAGSITGVTITGSTITGATIQTASGAVAKTVLDSSGFWVSDSGGSTKIITADQTNGITLTSGVAYQNQLNWKTTVIGGAQTGSIQSTGNGTSSSATYMSANIGGRQNFLTVGSNTTIDANNFVSAGVLNAAGSAAFDMTIIDGSGHSDFMTCARAAHTLQIEGPFSIAVGPLVSFGTTSTNISSSLPAWTTGAVVGSWQGPLTQTAWTAQYSGFSTWNIGFGNYFGFTSAASTWVGYIIGY